MMTDNSDQAIPRINSLSAATILLPSWKQRAAFESPVYCQAPEVIKNSAYDFKIDTWSFGVILHYLLTGQPHI
jgi:serine/threonine protein kinase